MSIKINYGTKNFTVDITNFCYTELIYDNTIIIPSNDDVRAMYFTDPDFGVLKKIFIIDSQNKTIEYDSEETVIINTVTNEIKTSKNIDINNKLNAIQSKLQIKHGNFNQELPEQKMAVRYLTGNEKVLEIGGNIGRNSLIIGSILSSNNNNNNDNFVSLECDPHIADQLRENRDLNNLSFHVESAALSKRKLIQKGWDTIESDVLLDGYKPVNTITLDELNKKYNIVFDTLVLDCEGAFYYILKDMPEILNNIKLIIMENDYHDISHKTYIDTVLKENNFCLDYVESGGVYYAYTHFPCYNMFFQVWKKC
jgi:FkbM family methyltransferase